jgi:hypothetical protein
LVLHNVESVYFSYSNSVYHTISYILYIYIYIYISHILHHFSLNGTIFLLPYCFCAALLSNIPLPGKYYGSTWVRSRPLPSKSFEVIIHEPPLHSSPRSPSKWKRHKTHKRKGLVHMRQEKYHWEQIKFVAIVTVASTHCINLEAQQQCFPEWSQDKNITEESCLRQCYWLSWK